MSRAIIGVPQESRLYFPTNTNGGTQSTYMYLLMTPYSTPQNLHPVSIGPVLAVIQSALQAAIAELGAPVKGSVTYFQMENQTWLDSGLQINGFIGFAKCSVKQANGTETDLVNLHMANTALSLETVSGFEGDMRRDFVSKLKALEIQ